MLEKQGFIGYFLRQKLNLGKFKVINQITKIDIFVGRKYFLEKDNKYICLLSFSKQIND